MRRVASALACAALLQACTTPGPVEPSSAPAAPAPAAEPVRRAGPVEADLLARAQRAGGERRWHEAVLRWEQLTLLDPESATYRQGLAAARQRAAAAAAAHAADGDAARRRGDIDAAALAYLKTLAADPEHAPAARALRDIERERARRLVNQRARSFAAPRM